MSTDRDVWTVLGLDLPVGGTSHDMRTIKRAYARALKAIDQSGDPAGFQRLRQSYERALELSKAVTVDAVWRRFASDIGASPSEIVQIDELIRREGTTVYPECQIALEALGDMERVAVLDQGAESGDACFVLNALLAKSGAVAVEDDVLAAIEREADTIRDKPIDTIETPVEYVAAKFSVVAAMQKLALLAIHDDGENRMFAIAPHDVGQGWTGRKLDRHIHVLGVDTLPQTASDDLQPSADTPDSTPKSPVTGTGTVAAKADLFHDDRLPLTAEADTQYAAYVRMVERAMAADSEEEAWLGLFDSLDTETPEMRNDVESMVFRTLFETQRSSNGAEHLPPSFTARVVDALDEQFQWLSDGVGFQRKFQQESDILVVALNAARGRKTSFSKILQKPNWLIVSLLFVVVYAMMRTFFDWLTALGVIS